MKASQTNSQETFSSATVLVAVQEGARVRIPANETIVSGLALKGVEVLDVVSKNSYYCQIVIRFRNDDPRHDPDLKSQGRVIGLIKRFFPNCAWVKVIKNDY